MSKIPHHTEQAIAGQAEKGPAWFRRRLEQLGPTFIKIGQYLALRPDLMPHAYSTALMRLQDRVPPIPWPGVQTILEEAFYAAPSELFSFVSPRPVASGPLAQVHIARFKDGTEVALKILRPNIEDQVLKDLERTRLLTRLLDQSGVSAVVSPQEVAPELTAWMMRQTDLRNELANLTRRYQLPTKRSLEKVPMPYPAFSTERILTTEYLRGVPLSELLHTLRTGQDDGVERIRALDIDSDELAENLVNLVFQQLFHDQFFHADLLPSTLVALPDNVIGFMDFSFCDELDGSLREQHVRYLSAVYAGDVEQMFTAMTEMLIPTDQTDMTAFRIDIVAQARMIDSESARSITRRQEAEEVEPSVMAQWMTAGIQAARRHALRIPPVMLSTYQALLAAETVARQLSSKIDLRTAGKTFFSTLQTREGLRVLDPQSLQATLASLLVLLRNSPGQLNQILAELSDGRFALKVDVSETPKVARARNRRTRLVVTSILSVGVAFLVAMPGLPQVLGISLAVPLAGVLAVLYVWIFLQWRRL